MLDSVSSARSSNTQNTNHINAGKDYVVQRGDTLTEIASRFGTDVDTLQKLNDISNPNRINAGQTITVPTQGKSVTVQRGDTLTEIAAKTGSSVAALMAANKDIRNANQIYPGQVVQIPAGQSKVSARLRPQVQNTQAPVAKASTAKSPVSSNGPAGSTASGQINLQQFFDPSKGGKALAAIVIGNAEGNRTPSGGFRSGYDGHIDPGNGKGNRGSFSYQHGTKVTTPDQADRAQLAKLSKLIPGYEAAAKKAGLDPNNATLATAYFDLFNQSETAAARFLNQIGDLKATGITNQSVTDLRFHSFINPTTGQRWTPGTASGFQKIANEKHGDQATEVQFQAVIRADQARRQNAMVDALKAQGILVKGASSLTQLPARTEGPATVKSQTTKTGVLSKWPVAKPKFNTADKTGEGDGHYGTHRKRGQHGGIDLVGKLGEPIFASGKGVVVDIQPRVSTTFGYQIVIDHGNGVFTQYAHLQPGSINVKPGDTVEAGQQIAGMGRSGNTPIKGDTHVHFEVRIGSSRPAAAGGKTVDPLNYLGQPK